MSEYASMQMSSDSKGVPSAGEFTSSPLRNRICVELDAPVSEVWELMGDLSRFPEVGVGLINSAIADLHANHQLLGLGDGPSVALLRGGQRDHDQLGT